MKIRVGELFNIIELLEHDRETWMDADQEEEFYDKEIDVELVEENVQEGKLCSYIKYEFKYRVAEHDNDDKEIVVEHSTVIEVFPKDEKTETTCKRSESKKMSMF